MFATSTLNAIKVSAGGVEVSRKKSRRTYSALFFAVSIAVGMQLALQAQGQGQNATSMPPILQPSSVNQLPPPRPSSQSPPLDPAPSPAPTPSPVQAITPTPPEALNKADYVEHMPQPTPTPVKKEVFVPSVVETFIPVPSRSGDPRAILHTTMGDIKIRLFPASAPANVRNFIDLARGDKDFLDVQTNKHAHRPFYINMLFHRVIGDYLIQTGCPYGNGHGGPGYRMPDELSLSHKFDKPGIVAMAPQRTGTKFEKDSNGSQIFISLKPMPTWNGNFTIIGEVEQGLAVAVAISRAKAGPTERPIKRVFLKNVEIIDEASSKAIQ